MDATKLASDWSKVWWPMKTYVDMGRIVQLLARHNLGRLGIAFGET